MPLGLECAPQVCLQPQCQLSPVLSAPCSCLPVPTSSSCPLLLCPAPYPLPPTLSPCSLAFSFFLLPNIPLSFPPSSLILPVSPFAIPFHCSLALLPILSPCCCSLPGVEIMKRSMWNSALLNHLSVLPCHPCKYLNSNLALSLEGHLLGWALTRKTWNHELDCLSWWLSICYCTFRYNSLQPWIQSLTQPQWAGNSPPSWKS